MRPLVLVLALTCMVYVNGRTLLQGTGCSASPGVRPTECTGFGSQWDNDEIECPFDNVQLKCDLDEDWFSDNDVDCELETGLFSDIEFKCNVDSECNIVCDDGVLGQIPQAYFAPVEKILAAWKPSD